MKFGPRIQRLLEWAENHSPRTKELYNYVEDLHLAMRADLQRLVDVRSLVGQAEAQRGVLASIISKQHHGDMSMTKDEFKMYASALINQRMMEYMGQPLTDELKRKVHDEVELVFEELTTMGCLEEDVREMRTNFEKSLVIS